MVLMDDMFIQVDSCFLLHRRAKARGRLALRWNTGNLPRADIGHDVTVCPILLLITERTHWTLSRGPLVYFLVQSPASEIFSRREA